MSLWRDATVKKRIQLEREIAEGAPAHAMLHTLEKLMMFAADDTVEAVRIDRRATVAGVLGTIGGAVEGHPTSSINYLQRLRELVALEEKVKFTCAARRQSLPEPADCDWPTCGCDPSANRVISALTDSGECGLCSTAAFARHDIRWLVNMIIDHAPGSFVAAEAKVIAKKWDV